MRAVLTYHSIDDSGSVISVAAATLARHLDALIRAGIAVVPLAELLAVAPDRRAVAVTFDDGFRNFADAAWPILADRGIPVTVFVPTERLGGTNDWNDAAPVPVPRLPLLEWDAVGQLAEQGVSIGSHTRTHVDLRAVSAARLEDELAGAADDIERRIGRRPAAFAHPFGYRTPEVDAAVRAVYSLGCTTDLGVLPSDPDPVRLPRLDTYYYRDNDLLARYGTVPFRAHLALRAGARRVRQRWTRAS